MKNQKLNHLRVQNWIPRNVIYLVYDPLTWQYVTWPPSPRGTVVCPHKSGGLWGARLPTESHYEARKSTEQVAPTATFNLPQLSLFVLAICGEKRRLLILYFTCLENFKNKHLWYVTAFHFFLVMCYLYCTGFLNCYHPPSGWNLHNSFLMVSIFKSSF